jgi:hypothetical protein
MHFSWKFSFLGLHDGQLPQKGASGKMLKIISEKCRKFYKNFIKIFENLSKICKFMSGTIKNFKKLFL